MSSIPHAKILIVGATGRIGRETVRLLSERKVPCLAMIRSERNGSYNSLDVACRSGDLRDKSSLKAALKDIEKVLLITPDSPEQANLESNLIDAAIASRVKHIVKISAFTAGLRPPESFGIQHAVAEEKLRNAGISWTILRPYMFMQNFVDFGKLIASKNIMVGPSGDFNVSFVDTRDIAAVAAQVLAEDGHDKMIYEITGPEAISFRTVAKIIGKERGKEVRYLTPPDFVMKIAMRMEGVSKWDVAMRMALFAVLRQGKESQITDVVEKIGRKTPYRFEDFVRANRQVFQNLK